MIITIVYFFFSNILNLKNSPNCFLCWKVLFVHNHPLLKVHFFLSSNHEFSWNSLHSIYFLSQFSWQCLVLHILSVVFLLYFSFLTKIPSFKLLYVCIFKTTLIFLLLPQPRFFISSEFLFLIFLFSFILCFITIITSSFSILKIVFLLCSYQFPFQTTNKKIFLNPLNLEPL